MLFWYIPQMLLSNLKNEMDVSLLRLKHQDSCLLHVVHWLCQKKRLLCFMWYSMVAQLDKRAEMGRAVYLNIEFHLIFQQMASPPSRDLPLRWILVYQINNQGTHRQTHRWEWTTHWTTLAFAERILTNTGYLPHIHPVYYPLYGQDRQVVAREKNIYIYQNLNTNSDAVEIFGKDRTAHW